MIYAIAFGSNRCHGRLGTPRCVVEAALLALETPIIARSRIIETAPLGPSLRRYANAAALIESDLDPLDLLGHLKGIERAFGRRRNQRWGARVLDLDIILWSGGTWSDAHLTIPHPLFRSRSFVLDPLCQIAAGWRDPISHRSLHHLKALLDRRLPLP
jgi:2-amino-4-hydroxy-6-hydroxymethyldihydropteridine diphosphokinase